MFAQPHPPHRWLALAKKVYAREWQLLIFRDAIFGPPMFDRDELAACNKVAKQLMAAEQVFFQALAKYQAARDKKPPQVVKTTFWASELKINRSSGSGQNPL